MPRTKHVVVLSVGGQLLEQFVNPRLIDAGDQSLKIVGLQSPKLVQVPGSIGDRAESVWILRLTVDEWQSVMRTRAFLGNEHPLYSLEYAKKFFSNCFGGRYSIKLHEEALRLAKRYMSSNIAA